MVNSVPVARLQTTKGLNQILSEGRDAHFAFVNDEASKLLDAIAILLLVFALLEQRMLTGQHFVEDKPTRKDIDRLGLLGIRENLFGCLVDQRATRRVDLNLTVYPDSKAKVNDFD